MATTSGYTPIYQTYQTGKQAGKRYIASYVTPTGETIPRSQYLKEQRGLTVTQYQAQYATFRRQTPTTTEGARSAKFPWTKADFTVNPDFQKMLPNAKNLNVLNRWIKQRIPEKGPNGSIMQVQVVACGKFKSGKTPGSPSRAGRAEGCLTVSGLAAPGSNKWNTDGKQLSQFQTIETFHIYYREKGLS